MDLRLFLRDRKPQSYPIDLVCLFFFVFFGGGNPQATIHWHPFCHPEAQVHPWAQPAATNSLPSIATPHPKLMPLFGKLIIEKYYLNYELFMLVIWFAFYEQESIWIQFVILQPKAPLQLCVYQGLWKDLFFPEKPNKQTFKTKQLDDHGANILRFACHVSGHPMVLMLPRPIHAAPMQMETCWCRCFGNDLWV